MFVAESEQEEASGHPFTKRVAMETEPFTVHICVKYPQSVNILSHVQTHDGTFSFAVAIETSTVQKRRR